MAAVLAPLVLATTPPRADHSLRPFLNSSHEVGFWRVSLREPELNEKELQRLLWDGYAFSDMKRDNSCAVAETCKGPKIGVVSYDYTRDSAGLKDRHYVLVSLWRLAASLCADLAVHPPATMLSETQHNFGRKLSPSLWWDRCAAFHPTASADPTIGQVPFCSPTSLPSPSSSFLPFCPPFATFTTAA